MTICCFLNVGGLPPAPKRGLGSGYLGRFTIAPTGANVDAPLLSLRRLAPRPKGARARALPFVRELRIIQLKNTPHLHNQRKSYILRPV